MADLKMEGPYKFITVKIDEIVTTKMPGNYALGYLNKVGDFVVRYVGRSDIDLNSELKARMDPKYTHFKYSYALTSKATFEEECRNYHDYPNIDNKIHPDIPDHTNWKCPYCPIFDD